MTGYRPSRGDGPLRFGAGVEQVPPVGTATVPASVYVDPARYAAELDAVFGQTWLIAGRSSQVPTAGDFLVWEEVGETIVIARQRDGSLSAFFNVCQHRGARIVAESGHCDQLLTCPWHGFSYDLTGAVRGVPDRGDFDPASLAGLRAPEVAVTEWSGWIWINLAGPDRAPDLLDDLGELVDELAPYRMEEMILHARRVWEMPVNWKVVVEGFCEVFHIPVTHRESIGDGLACRDTFIQLFDKHSMYVVPSSRNVEEVYRTQDHQATAVCHYLAFPNSIFDCFPTHIQMFTPIPTGVGTTKYEAWNLIQPGGDDEFLKQMDAYWEHFCWVADEDLRVAAEAGATAHSRGYRRSLFNDRECRLTHFHQVVDKHLAG